MPDVIASPPVLTIPPAPPAAVIDKPILTPMLRSSVSCRSAGDTRAVQPKPRRTQSRRVVPVPSTIQPLRELGPEVTRLPPRSSIFTIYDDAELETKIYEYIAGQLGKKPEELRKTSPFPPLKPLVPAGTPYVAKTVHLPPGQVVYEPGFVVHNRLHFEERNAERYGWDLGLAQPFVSTISFYKNVLLWPNSVATSLVVGRMDTNAGKCLPGSPTPYYLYPQGLTITGGMAEGIVITGLSFVIP